jgi:hypothetical protein
MIFAKKEHTQTNWRTQAETQEEFGICRIESLKPCSDPDQKAGWDHEETGDEDQEQCVANCPHATGCLSGISEFLQAPPVE